MLEKVEIKQIQDDILYKLSASRVPGIKLNILKENLVFINS